jgi:hypothetical protein
VNRVLEMVFDLILGGEEEGNAQGMCDKDEKVEKFPEIDLSNDEDGEEGF